MAGTTTYYGISYPTSTDYVKDGATAMQTIATGFDSAVAIPTYNNQTGTTYTFVIGDTGKTVTASNASASTYTIPPQSSVAWATGATLTVTNLGAGVVTFAGGVGVTVTNTAATLAQYSTAKLIRTGSDTWTVNPLGLPSGLTVILPTSIAKGASGTASASGGEVTFSGTEYVSLNGVFTTSYLNYQIVANFTSSNDEAMFLRYRVSGTDNSTSNYFYHLQASTSGASTYSAINLASTTRTAVASSFGTSSVKGVNITVYSPQATDYTRISGNAVYSSTSGGTNYGGGVVIGGFSATTSFDGFSLIPNAGTITGTIRVYGLKNG